MNRAARPPAPPLLVVYTGGTFGMRDTSEGLAVTADLEAVLIDLLGTVEPDPHRRQWTYVPLPRTIDSADADLSHALRVAATVREHAAHARGVIVVHGTDTLAYTAAVAAFALADLRVPVIFTGAQRPIDHAGSDAPANFAQAYQETDGEPGVRIAFGGCVLPAVRAIKQSSVDDVAFAAHQPIAPGARLPASLAARLAELGARDVPPGAALPSVGLLRVFPGLDPRLVTAAAQLYPDGLVLECYGAGTAPMSTPGMADSLRAATRAGTPVVAITQCQTGGVELDRYAVGAALVQAGVWAGHDLTAEAALAKLGVLSAVGLDARAMQEAVSMNLVGEQSSGYSPAAAL